jgi:hypothetical protein
MGCPEHHHVNLQNKYILCSFTPSFTKIYVSLSKRRLGTAYMYAT